MKTARLIKLRRLSAASEDWTVGSTMQIKFSDPPIADDPFKFLRKTKVFCPILKNWKDELLPCHTSDVKAVYEFLPSGPAHRHKVILPENFPDARHLDIPSLIKGDFIIGTRNSIYWVTDVQDENPDR